MNSIQTLALLQSNQTPKQGAESLPVLREEAVCSLKAGKSPGVGHLTFSLSCLKMEVRQQQQS